MMGKEKHNGVISLVAKKLENYVESVAFGTISAELVIHSGKIVKTNYVVAEKIQESV